MYENSKNEKIKDIEIFYIKLFGRKYVLLGEYHEYRHSENLINYSSLLKLPLKLSKEKRKCIDVYVESVIYEKPILNDNEFKMIDSLTRKHKYNASLIKLIRNLMLTEKYQQHEYYRLHSFDTRETTKEISSNEYATDIYTLLLHMNLNDFNFEDFLIEIFEGRTKTAIHDAIIKLLRNYCRFIEQSKNEEFEKINSRKKSVDFLDKKYRINMDFMCNYFFNVINRIYKEYGKVPAQYKSVDISPPKVIENLKHKKIFMTDMYLFYRLLMNFNRTERNRGDCKNYSETSFIMGGLNHIKNIKQLLYKFYGEQFEDDLEFESMSINEYKKFLNVYIFN